VGGSACYAVLFTGILATVFHYKRRMGVARTVSTEPGPHATADEKPSFSSNFTPSLWLLGLTYGWLLPLFCFYILLARSDPRENSLFLLVFSDTLAVALVLFLVEFGFGVWRRKGYWKKYFLIAGSYTLNGLSISFFYGFLDERGLIGYSDQCPGGSFMFLFYGSVVGCWPVGLIIVLFFLARDTALRMIKKKI